MAATTALIRMKGNHFATTSSRFVRRLACRRIHPAPRTLAHDGLDGRSMIRLGPLHREEESL